MHADVTQEANILKKEITTLGGNLFTPINIFEAKNPYPTQWVALMEKVSQFVAPQTDMMSARLKTGLTECLQASKYLTENVIKYLKATNTQEQRISSAPNLTQSLKNLSTALIKAMNELQKETYRFSAGKRAAKDVVEHLSVVLMQAIARVNTDAQQVENPEKEPAKTQQAALPKTTSQNQNKPSDKDRFQRDELVKQIEGGYRPGGPLVPGSIVRFEDV